jgi:hypothetical protein
MQFVNTSWSGMRALKNILGHFGIHLQLASEQEVAVKGHVNEFTVPLPYFRVHLDAGKAAKGKGVIDEGFGVRALREACVQQIRHQRAALLNWNGAVSLP